MNMSIDSSIIKQSGNDLLNSVESCKEVMNELSTMLNNMTSKTNEWIGTAANNYVERFNEDYKSFIDVNETILKFSQFLIDYSNEIETINKKY